MKIVVESQQQRREQKVNRTMILTPVKKAYNVMTIIRVLDNSVIKGPSEKIRSSSKEKIAQQQNTIEIELNKNKINNTSYDKQSLNNTEEDISQLATQYDVKGKESVSNGDCENKTMPDLYDEGQDINEADSKEES